MKKETQWWIATAERDLAMAVSLFEGEFFEGCSFHCQQASEKILKAVILELGEWERTHSGVEILVRLRSLGRKIPDEIFEDVRRLDRSFIDSRYPNGVGGPPQDFYDRKTGEEVMACCRRVMAWAKSEIS